MGTIDRNRLKIKRELSSGNKAAEREKLTFPPLSLISIDTADFNQARTMKCALERCCHRRRQRGLVLRPESEQRKTERGCCYYRWPGNRRRGGVTGRRRREREIETAGR